MSPASIPRPHLQAVSETLARFGWTALGQPEPVPNSSANDNYGVETDAGRRFVRIHRKSKTRPEIEAELRLLAWARGRLPVIEPFAAADGRTIFSSSGRLVTCWPWVEGSSIGLAEFETEAAAERMGALHGELDSVLAGYDGVAFPRTRMDWDTDRTMGTLSRIDDLIRYAAVPSELQLAVQRDLRFQLTLLEGGEAVPPSELTGLDVRPVHGDFHRGNVLFRADGSVAAIVDWDSASVQPALYGLVRALFIVCHLVPERVAAYLRAYCARSPVDAEVAGASVEVFWQNALHSPWPYDQRFIEGDHRAERFLAPQAANLRWLADRANRRRLADQIRAAAGA